MDPADLEGARRALYAPSASSADVARFAALAGEADRAAPVGTDAEKSSPASDGRTGHGPPRRLVRPLAIAGAFAVVAVLLGSWSLHAAPPPRPAPASPTAEPRRGPDATAVVDPVLWSPHRRAATAATLHRVLQDPTSADADSTLSRLVAPRFPHGSAMTGSGTGSTTAAISGMTHEKGGTVVLACDRPCTFQWLANIVAVQASPAGGSGQTSTSTFQYTGTGTAAAYVPMDTALPLLRGTSSIEFDVHTQDDVRFAWVLHLDED